MDLREKVQILYDQSIQAVVTLDLEIANSAVKSSHRLANEIASLIEGTFVDKPEIACTLVYRNLRELIRKMLDISSYCKTIAHIALNRAMEKENKVCTWSGVTTSVGHEFSQ